MIKPILLLTTLGLLAWGGSHWYSAHQHDQFLEEKKAEFSAYRLEHIQRERLLLLHYPSGKTDGVELANLNRVFLWRLNAADATDNQAHYYWVVENQRRSFTIPYFVTEPVAMLNILKKEITELDIYSSLKYAAEFENGKFNFCTIWASQQQRQREAASKTADAHEHTCVS